jgi:hypothetical protein
MDDRMGAGDATSSTEMSVTTNNRFSRRRLAAIAAVALAIGGAVAAVTAVGEGSKPARHARAGVVGPQDLAAAAAYLGVPSAQLANDLRAGKSLAQVANATPGKSSKGLAAALVSAKRERLSALDAGVTRRVSAEINRSGPGSVRTGRHARLGAMHTFSASGHLASVAAGYLGVSPAQLLSELQAGRTLAGIANATHGKSASGLISSLVAARRETIAAALGARRLPAARARTIEARLLRRFTAIVNRTLPRS